MMSGTDTQDNTCLEQQNPLQTHEHTGNIDIDKSNNVNEISELDAKNNSKNNGDQMESSPASAVDGGREISNTILYVGGLHKSVSEDVLRDLFSSCGGVKSIKTLNDKNRPGFSYAFVEFENTDSAELALRTLNGRMVNNSVIKINWAYQSSAVSTASQQEPFFNIFVGDLSPEVDDESLHKAFSKFESLRQAHVMWDMQTSRSRGYGFVSFGNQVDAELALQTMNGEWIGGRAIRCNWASHKQFNNPKFRAGNNRYPNHGNRQYRSFHANPMQPQLHNQPIMPGLQSQASTAYQPGAGNGNQSNIPIMSPQSFDIVLRQTPSWQTTVYLGNIAHFTQQTDLIPLLQNFGFIVDFKFHPEKGCAFVNYDSHERAALAIVQLAGFTINGRPLKCGWGKERPPINQFQGFPRGVAPPSIYPPGRQ
ncbi:Piso0_001392 [Millerozyma farinosa CBS 7064]|uniref:Piso0_001392 protein n=1 Tax=Pichia sorbitophila (strain ATCC MYA-4447 / BCRC 22081 / CBS 7064 / NBRC 10061 / NRRL Y-12695) TaxID=559304 RepID=G8YKN6_PICSO|nr:Piso0_001392 [Millerozyma farinosa CBS 7064]